MVEGFGHNLLEQTLNTQMTEQESWKRQREGYERVLDQVNQANNSVEIEDGVTFPIVEMSDLLGDKDPRSVYVDLKSITYISIHCGDERLAKYLRGILQLCLLGCGVIESKLDALDEWVNNLCDFLARYENLNAVSISGHDLCSAIEMYLKAEGIEYTPENKRR